MLEKIFLAWSLRSNETAKINTKQASLCNVFLQKAKSGNEINGSQLSKMESLYVNPQSAVEQLLKDISIQCL